MADQAVENIIIFKSPDDDWGEFSNQFPAPFTYMGIRFETVEQFLYYMRAVFGRSKATAEKVLACGGDSSALSKASKKQRILENNSWEAVRPQIMRIGMRQKFLQNPELRKKLLGTGFRLLVETSREGIIERLIPGNEDWTRDPGKWKGRNIAGKALMKVRADLRCADRLVGADEAYVFPEEPFILQTPVGEMTLKEIAALPGARESVRTYAEIAQQYQELLLANADDFINRHTISLVTMERAIASNMADIENALSRAKARSAGAEDVNVTTETDEGIDVDTETIPDDQQETAAEKLPDDLPAEGFYELLFDLDEMMKLGNI